MSRHQRRVQFRSALRTQLRRVPLGVWIGVCLAIAAFYVVVWPQELAPANPVHVRYLILRWFHPLAWLLLALSCTIRMTALPAKTRVANSVALLAAPTYAAFFLAVITSQ